MRMLFAIAAVLLASWFVLVLMLLVGKSWLRWTGRLLGWLILLPCAAIAADWLGPDWLGGPLPGSGGAIGRTIVYDQDFGIAGRGFDVGGDFFQSLGKARFFVECRDDDGKCGTGGGHSSEVS